MTAMSDYLEGAVRGWFDGTTFPSVPSDFYLALFTTATSDAGGGTEVTGGAGPYARQVVTFTAGSNDAVVLFTGLPACTVTHAAVLDASTAGNMLMHGALTTSKVVAAGESLLFDVGSIDLVFS